MGKCTLPPNAHEEDPFYQNNETVSLNECTGLVPAAPTENSEAENLSELYAIHSLKPRSKKRS